MVNGILRNLARHLDELPTLDRSSTAAYLSLLYSHPQWLVEEGARRWGNRSWKPSSAGTTASPR